jgi:hypothetical protein
MRSYARWTFWAAVAAVVAGIVGVLVTWVARQAFDCPDDPASASRCRPIGRRSARG